MDILLTGASGFVGKRFAEYNKNKYNIRGISFEHTPLDTIDFSGIETIVHLAGIAHRMEKTDPDLYFKVNFRQTCSFAEKAKASGVRHFIFISTIKVFGEHQNTVLNEQSPCLPINDPYGESKLKAEEYLTKLADQNFYVAIVRPPLVYGPGVKGNLIRFLRLADSSYPLPFKNVHNKRTMVFLDNLIELINAIIDRKGSGLFLAADDKSISTSYLIAQMRHCMGKEENLFILPRQLKWLLHKLKPEMATRLYGSLEIDASSTNHKISFLPPYTIEKGISEMTKWYNQNKHAYNSF